MVCVFVCFFFFKQKTAYEMRISDWSSDVCSSDLAQTLANFYQSIDHDHEIVPFINKIDLPAAEPDKVKAEIEDIIGLDASDAVLTSAKSGIGITEVLEAVVKRIPPPKGDRDAPLKAMLVDSWYDPYLGVVILVRVMEGRSEEHTSELQSLMRISYAVFCLKKKTQ